MKTKRDQIAALVGLLAFLAAFVAFRAYRQRTPDVRSQKFLTKIASQVNSNLPMMVDAETELTSVAALDGVLIYNHRLVSMTSQDVSAEYVDREFKPMLVNRACTTPETRNGLLNDGITMRYVYYDKAGNRVTSVDVRRSDCS